MITSPNPFSSVRPRKYFAAEHIIKPHIHTIHYMHTSAFTFIHINYVILPMEIKLSLVIDLNELVFSFHTLLLLSFSHRTRMAVY